MVWAFYFVQLPSFNKHPVFTLLGSLDCGPCVAGMGASLSVSSGRLQSISALSQRGVSYPPPSPRGLTRTQPVPQSRNPPLVKTRHLVSVAGVNNSVNSTSPAYLVEAAINPNIELTTVESKVLNLISKALLVQ